MSTSIQNYRIICRDCQENAPSQTAEPIIQSPAPEWSFQQICMDYFFIGDHAYLVVVDRYSGWPSVFHFKPGQTTAPYLLSVLRNHFASFGVPEESSSDGGPQFESEAFKSFLRTWGIHFRLSSVGYAQSNGRAEVGVKSMKRMLHNNISANGSLNNDKILRALLEYRNTPLPDINLSPAQILFHRQLKDAIPTHRKQYHLHKQWIIAANKRKQIFARKNKAIQLHYNKSTRLLPELPVGTKVLIQGKNKKWTKQGEIVEALKYRQYQVKVYGSGRTTLQNRRFLRPFHAIEPVPSQSANSIPQAPLGPPQVQQRISVELSTTNTPPQQQLPDRLPVNRLPPIVEDEEEVNRDTAVAPKRTPRSLRNLATYNKPGLREGPMNPKGRR